YGCIDDFPLNSFTLPSVPHSCEKRYSILTNEEPLFLFFLFWGRSNWSNFLKNWPLIYSPQVRNLFVFVGV
ncbi:hypothetical protein, partial [Microcoleus sp. Pol17_C1]|uniref:hypothetical protein n=1 Tax=Microcoleus sp. Pol17_C1 TaxID=2818881 RepID=UPI002FD373E6